VSKRTLRGKVAIAGVGETTYYRHGKSPVSEFKLALQAILAALPPTPTIATSRPGSRPRSACRHCASPT
jgi:hypothetical protein